MGHVSPPQRVALDWSFDQINFNQMMHTADIKKKSLGRSGTRLFNIMDEKSASCNHLCAFLHFDESMSKGQARQEDVMRAVFQNRDRCETFALTILNQRVRLFLMKGCCADDESVEIQFAITAKLTCGARQLFRVSFLCSVAILKDGVAC